MHILVVGKGATPEVCNYLQSSEFKWTEVIDERAKGSKGWSHLIRKLLSASEKKFVYIGNKPSLACLVALLISKRSAISIAYSLGGLRQKISWSLSALVVVSGGAEKVLAKKAGAKQVLIVRPYLKAAHRREEGLGPLQKPSEGTVFYCDSEAGIERFLRAIADTSFTALIPRRFLRETSVRDLVFGLGLRERVIPLPTKLIRDACLVSDAVIVSHNQCTYPDVFFSAGANNVGWLVAEGSACSRVFNSSTVSFDEESVSSLTDAMLKFDRDKKHLKKTVFIGPEEESEAVESLHVLFDYVA